MFSEGSVRLRSLRYELEVASQVYEALSSHNVRGIGVIGPVGAGKTTLIAQLAKKLTGRGLRAGVLVAWLGENGAGLKTFQSLGVPSAQVPVERGCQLTASQIRKTLDTFPLSAVDVLFIEDLGGLACQANRPLGTDQDLLVISLAGGERVLDRYPLPFIQTNVMALNKVDLAGAVGIDPQRLVSRYRSLNPYGKAVLTDALKGLGVEELLAALGF